MAHDPTWDPRSSARPRVKTARGSVACMLFVAAMGAAFWIGTFWASQSVLN